MPFPVEMKRALLKGNMESVGCVVAGLEEKTSILWFIPFPTFVCFSLVLGGRGQGTLCVVRDGTPVSHTRLCLLSYVSGPSLLCFYNVILCMYFFKLFTNKLKMSDKYLLFLL